MRNKRFLCLFIFVFIIVLSIGAVSAQDADDAVASTNDDDDTVLEDLPEVPDVIGGLVLDKSKEEMQYYLDYNEFPGSESDSPARRNSTRDTYDAEAQMPVRRRRTPATSDEDTF